VKRYLRASLTRARGLRTGFKVAHALRYQTLRGV